MRACLELRVGAGSCQMQALVEASLGRADSVGEPQPEVIVRHI